MLQKKRERNLLYATVLHSLLVIHGFNTDANRRYRIYFLFYQMFLSNHACVRSENMHFSFYVSNHRKFDFTSTVPLIVATANDVCSVLDQNKNRPSMSN